MKRMVLFILIFVLFGISGCQPPNKREMLEVYSNNENYVTLEGEIIEINNTDNNIFVLIKCEELKQYIPKEKEICEYMRGIFSSFFPLLWLRNFFSLCVRILL